MDSWIAVEILIISVLIVLSAFFSGSETALISVNKVRIRHLVDSGIAIATGTVSETMKN